MPETAPAGLRTPRAPSELFTAFTRMALQGFGGVLPIAQRELVERERWLTREEFVELLSLGQILPGPNIVNVALIVGDRFFGWRGAAAALAGMLAGPLVIVVALAMLYDSFAHVPAVAGALRGMGAVSAGLVISTALKLLPTLGRNPMGRGACALVMLATVATVAGLRWPLLWVVGGLGSTSMAYAAWRLRRR